MPDIKGQDIIARKILPIIYVLDTSGSMEGDRISAVNSAMSETMEVLRDVSRDNPTAELKIGVLQFSTGAKWLTDSGLIFMEDFFWNDLKAGGLTDFGSALKELNMKMSRTGFFDSQVGYKVPVIIFLSDGQPTDDYESALKKINASNNWFKVSTKLAMAVGDDANIEVLQKIVGNKEAVIKVEDLETLRKLIRVVSVTASMIGSKSRTDSDSTDDIMNGVKETMGNEITIETLSVEMDPPVSESDDTDAGWEAAEGWGNDTMWL